MKLPSINYLFNQAKHSAIQFPITLICSLLGVSIGIYLIEYESVVENLFPLLNFMLCLGLGIPLFFCVAIVSKKLDFSSTKKWGLTAGGVVALVLIYITLPSSEQTANTSVPYIRYTIYNIALHLLVSFAPYVKGKELNGFWQYNRLLFMRFILAVIYSGFLYVGIALALGSLDLLFDVRVDGKRYGQIFILIGGFFNTWFFVSGIPDDLKPLEEDQSYPFGLKIFSQYILLPLLLLYLFILYAYGAKIVALWDWPRGIVSWLIVAVSVLGILTFLLIHPFGQKEENSWIKKFTKVFYYIVVPLIGMLGMAISIRVSEYGITINRYIIILLGVWLTLLCVYFIIGKNNVKFIPISLCVLILLMSFGPWSMFSVSERSQSNRLEELLTEHGILENGKVANEQTLVVDSNFYSQEFEYPNQTLLNDSLCNEVMSMLDYLDDHHGFNAIKGWFDKDYVSEISAYNKTRKRWSRINEAELYMKAMGLEYKYYWTDENNNYFSYSTSYYSQIIDIKGYDYMLDLNYYYYDENNNQNNSIPFTLDSIDYSVKRVNKDHYYLELFMQDSSVLAIDIDALKDKLVVEYGRKYQNDLPKEKLLLAGESDEFYYKLELQNINFRHENGKTKAESVNGKLFLRKKEKVEEDVNH